ncbi:MAG: hypothetical protein FD149_821 [Rhodospirillaceae bacterium]|nr:MAG: hypothetical protein FD149_821 [Rhodospirillaceae bacterium]
MTLGLSPRMRGNLQAVVMESEGPGSIPAHAGEPLGCVLLFCLYTVKERYKRFSAGASRH